MSYTRGSPADGPFSKRAGPGCTFGRCRLAVRICFFDQIEVVEQPFPGRCNPEIRLDRSRQQSAGSNQDFFILSQPRQELVRSASQTQLMRIGQGPAMLFSSARC